MDQTEIAAKLEAEIAKTEALIEEYKEFTKPISPDDAIGRVSRMDAINNKSVMESALRKAEEKLRKLKHVKSTLGQPGFGLCARCEAPIQLGRILLMPESVYCMRCAQ